MNDLDAIEKSIVYASKSRKSWEEAAMLTEAVEANELWRTKPNTRSFTVWMNAICSDFGTSKSWLWQAYRAGQHLKKIWDGGKHELVDIFSEFKENEKSLSANGVMYLQTIRNMRPKEDFVVTLENEFFAERVNITELRNICTDMRRAKDLNLKPIETFACLHRVDFSSLIGSPYSLLSDITLAHDIDAFLISKSETSEGVTIGGIKLKDFDSDFPSFLDYKVAIVTDDSDVSRVQDREAAVMKLESISGVCSIIKTNEIRSKNNSSIERIRLLESIVLKGIDKTRF